MHTSKTRVRRAAGVARGLRALAALRGDLGSVLSSHIHWPLLAYLGTRYTRVWTCMQPGHSYRIPHHHARSQLYFNTGQ